MVGKVIERETRADVIIEIAMEVVNRMRTHGVGNNEAQRGVMVVEVGSPGQTDVEATIDQTVVAVLVVMTIELARDVTGEEMKAGENAVVMERMGLSREDMIRDLDVDRSSI